MSSLNVLTAYMHTQCKFVYIMYKDSGSLVGKYIYGVKSLVYVTAEGVRVDTVSSE